VEGGEVRGGGGAAKVRGKEQEASGTGDVALGAGNREMNLGEGSSAQK